MDYDLNLNIIVDIIDETILFNFKEIYIIIPKFTPTNHLTKQYQNVYITDFKKYQILDQEEQTNLDFKKDKTIWEQDEIKNLVKDDLFQDVGLGI